MRNRHAACVGAGGEEVACITESAADPRGNPGGVVHDSRLPGAATIAGPRARAGLEQQRGYGRGELARHGERDCQR